MFGHLGISLMHCAAVAWLGNRQMFGAWISAWIGAWAGLMVAAWCGLLASGPVAAQGVATAPAMVASAPLLSDLSDRTLRVGLLADFQPYQQWPEGALGAGGADVELLNLLSAGRGPRWKLLRYTDTQQLETDLAEGRLDMAMSMARTSQRSARLDFSVPYASVEQGLLAAVELSSDTVSPDLSGRTVAVVKDSAAAGLVANNFPAAKRVVFDSTEKALRAVTAKQVDLVFEALPALQQVIERERIVGLRVVRSFKFDEGRLRLAVAKGNDELLLRLNTALAAVSPAQQAELERRWLVVPTLTTRSSRLVLTDAERQLLATLPPLRVGFIKTDRPFAFVNEAGEPDGLAIELMRDLRTRLGVRLDSMKGANVGELLDDLAQDKIDVVLGVTETTTRRQVAVFVGPYLSYPMALIAKPGSNFLSLVDLVGHTLALPRGYFPIDRIRARFPGIRIIDCGPNNTCLDMVARGEADATMNNLPAAGMRLSQRTAGAPLQIVGMANDVFDQHSVALRPALAAFAPVLKRALDESVANDLPVLQRKWLLPQVTTGVDPKLVQRGLMATAVIITLLLMAWLWHTRVMAGEISARREAQGRAEQASQERQRYLAFLAHEVRNSLNAVIGGLSLLRQRESAVDQPAAPALPAGGVPAPALMAMVDGSARSTLGLLNDLLDYHRVDAGRLTLDMRPARLAEVARAVVAEMQPVAIEKGLSLGLEATGDLHAWHQLDTVRVGQVLRNLIANAVKFTSKGKVHVRLHIGSRLSMAVQDSGIGIAPELAQRIFEPFEQAPGQAQQGTGLGLALSRELVRAMAGDISLQSQPGAGSLFTAEWPAVAAPAEALERRVSSPSALVATRAPVAPVAPVAPAPRAATATVEDSPVYAVSMQAMLLQQGWQVRTAVSVDLALQAFDSLPPQLLLCDLHLTDGTAFDLLSRITATRQSQGLRMEVVVMTADPDPQDVEELRQAGADRVITKSFDAAEMTRRVFEPA
jgi:two-component system, NarL family, sensor histidine kinase EvgS